MKTSQPQVHLAGGNSPQVAERTPPMPLHHSATYKPDAGETPLLKLRRIVAERDELRATVNVWATGFAEQAEQIHALRSENAKLREALADIEANLTGRDNLSERIADSLRRATAALKGADRE